MNIERLCYLDVLKLLFIISRRPKLRVFGEACPEKEKFTFIIYLFMNAKKFATLDVFCI